MSASASRPREATPERRVTERYVLEREMARGGMVRGPRGARLDESDSAHTMLVSDPRGRG